MSYNVAQHIIGLHFNVLHDSEKWRIYLKPFSCDLSMRHLNGRVGWRTGTCLHMREQHALTYVHMHAHTHTLLTPLDIFGDSYSPFALSPSCLWRLAHISVRYFANVFHLNLWPWNEGQRRWESGWRLTGERTLSTCTCMLKVALLDEVVCSQYIIIHFMKQDEPMNAQIYCPLE